MSKFEDHASCEAYIRAFFDKQGVDVTVTETRPLVVGPYTQPGMTCPHGTTFWMEPTGEQIAAWVKDGVA